MTFGVRREQRKLLELWRPSVLSPKYEVFCAIKMGRRQGGPSRTGGWREHIMKRYVTDGPGCSRRPIFIATLWAGASWLFFRVARSHPYDKSIMGASLATVENRAQLTSGKILVFRGRTLATLLLRN